MLFDDFGNWLYWDANWVYYTYTGQEYDGTPLNAYNLRARQYYPKLGIFMQNDPIGDKGGLNWYLYVANNPVNHNDITGMISKWQILCTLGYTIHLYFEIKDSRSENYGKDKLAHCMASCEISKSCFNGSATTPFMLGLAKEVWGELKLYLERLRDNSPILKADLIYLI